MLSNKKEYLGRITASIGYSSIVVPPATSEETYIYGLREGKEFRYIGRADVPKERFREHLHPATLEKEKNGRKRKWLVTMIERGEFPEMDILMVVPKADFGFYETWMIARYKIKGHRLTNMTTGGDGTMGFKWSDEQRANFINKMTGRVVSEEVKALLSSRSLEQRKACSEEQKLEKLKDLWSNEDKRKASLSAYMKANPISPERRAKMAAGMIGHIVTPETRKKIIENRSRENDASLIRGVVSSSHGKWGALINVNNTRCHIGVYDTEFEASEALERVKQLPNEEILEYYAPGVRDLSANWTPEMRESLSEKKRGKRDSRAQANAASRYLGVFLYKKSGSWGAQVNNGSGERTYIGSFNTEQGAASAYNREMRKLYGPGAPVNEIEGGEIEEPALTNSHPGFTKPNRTSRYPGVSWNNNKKRWMAKFTLKKVRHLVGQYLTEELAYEAYKMALAEAQKAVAATP